ncbi:MAG TPA: hypothetical protein VH951_04000, partial [Dehalococcoidia bacterium]
IDAYTAVTFDPTTSTARVLGQSGITLIGDGESRRFEAGATIPFSDFTSSHRSVVATFDPAKAIKGYEFADKPASGETDASETLAAFVERLGLSRGQQVELLSRIEQQRPRDDGADSLEEPLLDLLVQLRSDLRKEKQFALADKTRDALAEMGVEIGDTPQGTTWSRKA